MSVTKYPVLIVGVLAGGLLIKLLAVPLWIAVFVACVLLVVLMLAGTVRKGPGNEPQHSLGRLVLLGLVCCASAAGSFLLRREYRFEHVPRHEFYHLPLVRLQKQQTGDIWWMLDVARQDKPNEQPRLTVVAIFGYDRVVERLRRHSLEDSFSQVLIGVLVGLAAASGGLMVFWGGMQLARVSRGERPTGGAPARDRRCTDRAVCDFQVVIESGARPGEYLIRVEASPLGERPRRDADAPPPEVLAADGSMLEGTGNALRHGRPWGEQPLHTSGLSPDSYGRKLAEWLFDGVVRDAYVRASEVARARGQELVLRLWVKAPNLAMLPWELLFNEFRQNYFVLLTPSMVRSSMALAGMKPMPLLRPLQVLAMTAEVSGLPTLDLSAERARLTQALAPLVHSGHVALRWVEGSDRAALAKALREGPCHVFHFAGHGQAEGAQTGLLLAGDDGAARCVTGSDLAAMLDVARPSLVVLNSCEGAMACPMGSFASVAEALGHHGVPAVVAMQSTVSDRAAVCFAQEFYGALADGAAVDAALTAARLAMKTDGSLAWATPVLFLNAKDGRLFELSAPTADSPSRTDNVP